MLLCHKLDLHGETAESAVRLLTKTLKQLPKDTAELKVIHGYHRGNVLQEVVRKYKHPRIKRKIMGLNQGTTIFVLKNNGV